MDADELRSVAFRTASFGILLILASTERVQGILVIWASCLNVTEFTYNSFDWPATREIEFFEILEYNLNWHHWSS